MVESMDVDRLCLELGESFVCSSVGDNVRIRTPYTYPDGDVIDIFAVELSSGLTLTDYGETLRWLRMQAANWLIPISDEQRRLIGEVCIANGIEQSKGMLIVRVKPGEDIASAVTRLCRAAARIAVVGGPNE